MLSQLLQRGRLAVPGEVFRRAAHHPPVGEQPDRDVVGVGHPADADAHVVALADQVDHAVGQVEGQLEVGELLVEAERMRRDVQPAERGRRRHQQVALDHRAAAADVRLHIVELAQQLLGPLQQLLAQLGQTQPPR
ncbi:hypothetical protein D9M70_534230 [compost metagenome]